MKRRQKFYLIIKRLIGIFGSLIGIVFCFSLIWWWVFIINLFVTKGHPFYSQKRIGKYKKVFKLLKFRSMKVDAPEIAPNDLSVEEHDKLETRFGRFLRVSSIDETVQLLNILVGHMAFIGPRPGAAVNEDYLIEEREKFTPNAYDVLPGLSGLAQVKMDRKHDPKEKAYYDHLYVEKISLWLDIKIFFVTIGKIFGRICGR